MDKNSGQKEHIGIDFGTTNISITGLILDEASKKRFPVRYHEDGVPFPSILSISNVDGSLKIKFGRKVKSQMAVLEEQGEKIIKSLKTATADEDLQFDVFGKKLNPELIVGGLMNAIKKFIKSDEKHPFEITEATIAVPVDFTLHQRKILIEAFEQRAKIKVKKIISESTAAYISNRKSVENYSNVMVFDWGGGTLDISLLNIDKPRGRIHELATAGWAVAGDRIDEIIAEYLHNKILKNKKDYSIDISFKGLSPKDRNKILTEAEAVKIHFSDEGNTDEPKLVFMTNYCGEKGVQCEIDYDTFSELLKDIIGDATKMIITALQKAGVNINMLGAIIMVGGSSNLLPLRQYMTVEFENRLEVQIVYPERVQWSVSEGAAIIDSMECGYALGQDISLLMSDGKAFPILSKGMQIPIDEQTVSFGTTDNAESASFIFCDDNDNLLLTASMNSKGYDGEKFEVKAKVGNDLVAQITLDSIYRMAQTASKNFEIRGLNLYYDISQIDKYDTEELG